MILNHQTLAKCNRVRELINNKKSDKEILKEEFRNRKSILAEHIEKAKEFYTPEEINHLMGKDTNNSNEMIEVSKTNNLMFNKKLAELDELLSYKDELINLIKSNKEPLKRENIINHLILNTEIASSKDYKITSVRLSEAIEKRFNSVCSNYKAYSKTQMINQALIEFIEKYEI